MRKTIKQSEHTFNRFELKYLITLQQAEAFKNDLKPYMVPDQYGKNQGHYDITNLYYDSPELRCYWEKESGVRVRRKLRMRRYGSQEILMEDTPVFLEIKQRVDRVTQKRRAVLTYGEALRLCNDRQMPETTTSNQAFIEEVYAFLWEYNLRPMAMVNYDRHAFMGTAYDMGLRITFDTNLTSQSHTLHLHEQTQGYSMFPANRVVMEIKVDERIPRWVTELIAKHNLQLDRISKYCRAIDTITKMSTLPQCYLPAESSQDVLSSTYSVYTPIKSKSKIKRTPNS